MESPAGYCTSFPPLVPPQESGEEVTTIQLRDFSLSEAPFHTYSNLTYKSLRSEIRLGVSECKTAKNLTTMLPNHIAYETNIK